MSIELIQVNVKNMKWVEGPHSYGLWLFWGKIPLAKISTHTIPRSDGIYHAEIHLPGLSEDYASFSFFEIGLAKSRIESIVRHWFFQLNAKKE